MLECIVVLDKLAGIFKNTREVPRVFLKITVCLYYLIYKMFMELLDFLKVRFVSVRRSFLATLSLKDIRLVESLWNCTCSNL